MHDTPFLCWKHWSVRLQLAARDGNVLFGPKNLDIWGKKSIFCMVITIFVNKVYHKYTRSYTFPIWTTPKKISVSELGVIFWGSPLFLAVLGHSHFRGISTLNFGPFSTKLGGTVRAIKKWPRMTMDPIRAGISEKRPFLHSAEVFFWSKRRFIQKKKHLKFFKRLIFIFGKM